MGCYKIDKIDKIVISFTLIIVTMICIFNSFCLASEDIEIIKKDGLGLEGNNFVNVDANKGYYFETIPGYTYKIIFNRSLPYRIVELNGIPELNFSIGNGNGKLLSINDLSEYTFTAKKDMYYIYAYNNNDFTLQVENLTVGYKASIIQLTNLIDLTFFGAIIEKLTPFIFVVITFSLGVWFIKHNIIEHSKGREY